MIFNVPLLLTSKYVGCILIIAISVLELLYLFGITKIQSLMTFCSIILVLVAYKNVNKGFKKMSMFFFVTGCLLGIATKQPLERWLMGTHSFANITAILVIMQLFSVPIRMGDYTSALTYAVFKIFKSDKILFICMYIIIHLLSSFLLFGTIPVAITLIKEPIKHRIYKYKYFLSVLLTRSYGTVILWAPGAVNVLLVMDVVGIGLIDIFPIGMILSILGITLSYFMQYKKLSHSYSVNLEVPPEWISTKYRSAAYHKILIIIFVVVGLTLSIFIMKYIGILNVNLQIMLAGLVVSLVWIFISYFQVGLTPLVGAVKDYILYDLNKSVDLAFLYVALGFFSKMLEDSGMFNYFVPYVLYLSETFNILLIPIIAIIMLGLSIIGLHPFILIIVLGNILTHASSIILPVSIGMSLLLGASISYIVSPFAGIVLTTSRFLNVPISDVGLRWNGLFGLLFLILGSIIIMLCQIYIQQ